MKFIQNDGLSSHLLVHKFWCSTVFGIAAVCGLSQLASGARLQAAGKSTPVAQAQEESVAKPMDKQQLAELKVQMQQKQLAEDTARLFQLANELKASMDKATKDTLSLDVVRKAEQVEKLAHKVREEMKASISN